MVLKKRNVVLGGGKPKYNLKILNRIKNENRNSVYFRVQIKL